ncbi:MAG: hypothetical protein JWP10_682, partial [Nocardioidaceae bacterium]|nr:hypothetical protein [Nocardioidaceae bacterium]
PLFMKWSQGYGATHSLLGVFTIDIVMTIALLAAWTWRMREALVDLSPDYLRLRLAPRTSLEMRQRLLIPAAACLGAGTHVVWDAFTHEGRWGWRHVGWLRSEHLGLVGTSWAQYVSGVLGLAIVGWTVVAYFRAAPLTNIDRPAPVLPSSVGIFVVAVAALTGVATAFATLHQGMHAVAFSSVINALIALALGLGCACAVWIVKRPWRVGV